MDSCGTALKQWRLGRSELYSNLSVLADDLHGFHIQASKVKAMGTTMALMGTATQIIGLMPGLGVLQLCGRVAHVTGGMTVGLTNLAELYNDWTAIDEAKRLLVKHNTAHEDLRKHLSVVGLSMNSLNHHHAELTDLQYQRLDTTAAETASTVLTLVGVAEKKLEGVKSVLNEIDVLINRDIPRLFDSWLTMEGLKVPRTVQRLRLLRNDLQREEDDLMLQFESLFSRLGL